MAYTHLLKRNIRHKQRAGFTLVETLVAITVLVMAVAAPLTLGSQGLTASRIARDQIVATYLAQEAIEYIRVNRDTNILSGQSWLSGFTDCLAGTCRIDVPAGDITKCEGKCEAVGYNDASGIYGYTKGWETTKFSREVTIEQVVLDVEAKIVVSVSWQDGALPRTVQVDEHIFNWQ